MYNNNIKCTEKSGELTKGCAGILYYLWNFLVNLKLFQNSLVQQIKETDVLVAYVLF